MYSFCRINAVFKTDNIIPMFRKPIPKFGADNRNTYKQF